MKVLVIGGTGFIGRHITMKLLEQGHEVTHFNRGFRAKYLFQGHVETIIGDRKTDLDLLSSLEFDLLIDTYGYYPSEVEALCLKMKNRLKHYLFISTVSVYDSLNIESGMIDENSPVKLQNFSTEPKEITLANYGALKFQCEKVVEKYFPHKNTIIRPGYVVGPYDHTHRLPYWIKRISIGGNILVPGDLAAPIQFIDVRDLAHIVVKLGTSNISGVFNAAGPGEKLQYGDLLKSCQKLTLAKCNFIPCPESLLNQYPELTKTIPFWTAKQDWACMRVSTKKIGLHGLNCRPYQETLNDILNHLTNIDNATFPYGMLSPSQEAKLLSLRGQLV